MNHRYSLLIEGVVQGVGFRPFIYTIAVKNRLTGFVFNNGESVVCEIQGEYCDIDCFMDELTAQAPNASHIDYITKKQIPLSTSEPIFKINSSTISISNLRYISPDLKTCDKCKAELYNESNRRYEFPFINCTQCGPRFSIINSLPYDRISTTMSDFTMCKQCQKEYEDVLDRRFHAEPICCHHCAPPIWISNTQGTKFPYDSKKVRDLIVDGNIIAYKGIGGFQLICDATNVDVIEKLRKKKKRDTRPFALMARDIHCIEKICVVSESEKTSLLSAQSPIVILQKKVDGFEAASKLNTLGIMLPYSPLHCLLFDDTIDFLIATSANISGEPMIYTNDDAFKKLQSVADYFVFHDRDILMPMDDSILSHDGETTSIIRRARGYVPIAVDLSFLGVAKSDIIAYGAELKNTFCITSGSKAILSQHIGDLKTYEVFKSYEELMTHFKTMFNMNHNVSTFDSHPLYLSTQTALQDISQRKYPIQHHYAHIISCMAENQFKEKVIGVAFDGTGYGDDATMWGGEFFICDFSSYQRFAHLEYIKMPGGDLSVKNPVRMKHAYLYQYGLFNPETPEETMLFTQLEKNINCPLTSSAGRLFDAVSSLIGLCDRIEYEAQGAIMLEDIAEASECDIYKYTINPAKVTTISFKPMFVNIMNDINNGITKSQISMKFHRTIADAILNICIDARCKTEINTIALSGGVFQNRLLLSFTQKVLKDNKFNVLTHSKVPSNDGGISLGQAALAYYREGL